MDEIMKCPICTSTKIVKRGKRKGKFGNRQLYYCKNCNRRFTNQMLKYTVHPPRVIFYALNYYNLGYTLEESSKHVNRRFKTRTSKSTVHSWIKKYQDLCPVSIMRKSFSCYENVLFTKRFEHENLDYEFMYHKYKLDVFVREQFPGLAKYITRFEQGCPDVFFEVGERCSQPMFETNAKVNRKKNLACDMAGFAVQATRHNRERHKLVEKFMLINDTATIACETPVWYWDKKIDNGVTGHIDVLQVRNDLVYILDYKPDAERDKKAPWQLYHYAVALSYRTRMPLKHIRCAWFDENSYHEYNPSEVNVKPVKKRKI